jgi:hypothetical protein
LVPYLQKYVSSKTGHNISIDNFSISPFKLSISNIDADGIIKAEKITFELNPLKLLLKIFSSARSIRQIEVSNLEIDLKENQDISNTKSNKKKAVLKLPEMGVDVIINNTLIKRGTRFFNITNTHVYVDDSTIKLNSILHAVGSSVKLEALLKQKEGYLFDVSILLASKDKINMFITSKGIIDLFSFDTNLGIAVVNFDYKGFDFGGASGTLLKNEKGIDVKVGGNFGKVEINGLFSDATNTSASVDISHTNKSVSGKFNINFTNQKNSKELKLKVSNLNAFDFNFGSFEVSGKENNNGTYKVVCDYGLGRKLEVVYLQDGNYEGDLIIRNKKAGDIKGNIKIGSIIVDAKNISITDMPIMHVMTESVEGKVNVSGSIDKVSGKIDFYFNNLKISDMKKVDAKGTIIRDKNKYIFDFYKSDNSISLKNIVVSGKSIFTDFKFKKVNILNVLRIIGHSEVDISGTADGHIKYEKDVGVKFDVRVFNGTFYGNDFKEFEGKGDTDFNKLEIERFIIKNSSNTVTADIKGLIGFTDENPESFLYMDMRELLVQGVRADGHIEFHGHFSDGKKVKGILKATGTKIDGMFLGNIKADANISTRRIDISNLKSDSGLSAAISANLKRNKITGTIDFKDTSIEGVYPGVRGVLDASIKFSDKLTNPYIEVSALLKKGAYLSQPFSLSSEISYKDGVVNVNKADIVCGKAKVSLNGECSDLGHLYLTVNNLDENVINALLGFTLPFKGGFFGKGEIRFPDKRPELKIYLETKNAYINSLKLKDFKSEIEIVNKNIKINSASAKISNSEIRIDKGFCDLNNNKYSLDLFLLNIHAGPVALFGNVKLSGDILKENEESLYKGVVDINNLWLNKYKLDHYLFNYFFKNGILKLFQKHSDEKNDFDFSGEVLFGDTLSVKRLNIVKGYPYFDMSGDFSKDYINFEIAGFGIDWKFMENFFNFPGSPAGLADVYVKLKGKVDALEGRMSVVSLNGTLMNVPFDKLGVYIDFYDSCAYIKEATVSKKNGINIAVGGSFPIHFSEETSKELVDITYEVEDNKLEILNYFSDGFLNHLNGRLVLKGHIGGSYKNLKSNGKLSIYNGMFKSNEYLDKIKNLLVEISLIDNLIKIDKFTFNSGSGKVNGTGRIKLKNFSVKDFDVRIFTEGKKGIPVFVHQLPVSKFMGSKFILKDYSYGEPLFDIKISGNPEKPLISGYIVLENTRFTFPGEKDSGDSNFSLPGSTEFDLDLRTGINTKFENSIVSALIRGALHINGRLNSLKSKGIIELTSGRLDCFGIDFDIVSAKLEIIDDNQIYVTVEGETRVPSKAGVESETIKLFIKRCKLSELSTGDAISFSSKDDPNMDPQKAFDKVMGMGQDKEATSLNSETDFILKSKVLKIFNQNFSTPLTRSLLRKVGIADNFRISYVNTSDTVSEDETPGLVNLLSGTRYTMDKNISKNILFGYNLIFDEFQKKLALRHGIEFRYRLMPNLFLEGSYEFDVEEGSREPDKSVILQYHFRFGPSKKQKN